MTYDRRSEVSNMEWLRKVWRGIVKNNRLALAKLCGSAVFFTLLKNLTYNLFCKCGFVKKYIKISVDRFGTCNTRS